MSTQPEPVNQAIKKFAEAQFESFKPQLMKFVSIAKHPDITDEAITSQLSIFLLDIAELMASKYEDDIEDKAQVVYDITRSLTYDSRVAKAVGVANAIWETVPELQDLTNLATFKTFEALRKATKSVDHFVNKGTCSC